MNSFFIQLYINPLGLSDRIAVGLFLSVDHHVQFDYSKRKWSVASKLLPDSAKRNVEHYLKDVKKQVDYNAADRSRTEAFDIPQFSSDYFEYLSGYANNLITYSDPKAGAGNFSPGDFEELFRMMVDTEYPTENNDASEIRFNKIIHNRLENSAVKEKADIRYNISEKYIYGIYRPHKVDYIGRNGSFFSGSHIDITSRVETIEKRVMIFKSIVQGLNLLEGDIRKNSFDHHVLYFNDPTNDAQKKTLDKIRKDDTVQFAVKNWDDFECEEEWIKNEENTIKFSEYLEQLKV